MALNPPGLEMGMAFIKIFQFTIVTLACLPFVYYLLAIYASWIFPSGRSGSTFKRRDLALPPASILKPVHGVNWQNYENFASFCRQDYPVYEVLFCVGNSQDPAIPIVEKLIQDFPDVSIRLLVGTTVLGASDKVNKLCRLAREARYDFLVASDADIRVGPDYLQLAIAPLLDPSVGMVTSLFRGIPDENLVSRIDAAGAMATFCANAALSCVLEGVRFVLGTTLAIRRETLADLEDSSV